MALNVLSRDDDPNAQAEEFCPLCDQPLSHDRFIELSDRLTEEKAIEAKQVETRLNLEWGKKLADAAEAAKKTTEAAMSGQVAQAIAAQQAAETRAAAVVKNQETALTKARAEATEATKKATETAMAAQVAKATAAQQAAEARAASLEKSQEAVLTQRLQEQREALGKDKTEALSGQATEFFKKEQKLTQMADGFKRQLEQKTAEELGDGAQINLFDELKAAFPTDQMQMVKKGIAGVDIIHKIVDDGRVCGCIVYDSKNRNQWRTEFVAKLREDQLAAKAEYAILASQKFPQGTAQITIRDSVIVLHPARVVSVATLLREHLLQVHRLGLSNEARVEKSEALMNFITSDRAQQLLERFNSLAEESLQLDVDEQSAHQKVWKKRGTVNRSIQRAYGEFSTEINSIIAGPPSTRGAS